MIASVRQSIFCTIQVRSDQLVRFFVHPPPAYFTQNSTSAISSVISRAANVLTRKMQRMHVRRSLEDVGKTRASFLRG